MQSFLCDEREQLFVYKRAVVLVTLLLAQIFIITTFSSQDAQKSSEISRSVMNKMEWVPDLIPRETAPEDGGISLHLMIRKLAHFYNFFVVGVLLGTIHLNTKENYKRVLLWAAFGLLIGIADETLQHFIPGRNPKVYDVFVDFSGVLFGMISIKVFLGIIFAKRWKRC